MIKINLNLLSALSILKVEIKMRCQPVTPEVDIEILKDFTNNILEVSTRSDHFNRMLYCGVISASRNEKIFFFRFSMNKNNEARTRLVK